MSAFNSTTLTKPVACLICERVEPACGWKQPVIVQSSYDPVVRAVRYWSVCQDCVDRQQIGGD